VIAPHHPVAQLQQVRKDRGGRTILNAFDFAVQPGEVTALLGPNGAGKSTTVGLLTGHLAPDAGNAALFGQSPRAMAARQRMGVMMQAAGLPETLTVREQLTLFHSYYPQPRALAHTVAIAGIDALLGRRCDTLSGGEARRVQFAMAICGQPDLLVLDEPTTGFDAEARRQLWASVRAQADAGAAVLLTTHYLEEAEALADRIVVIAAGRIIADGTPAQIKAAVSGSTVRCRTQLAAEALMALPAVRTVSSVGADMAMTTSDAPATLRALLASDATLTGLSVTQASLEDALADLLPSTSPALEKAA
jgi:ABC-2 type transport system ATP-binding protein